MSKSRSGGTEGSAARPAPDSGETFERLKCVLREMFQLDRGDLDFGLYRVMTVKAGEIEAFLDRDLLPQVKDALAGVADGERARTRAELDETVERLTALKAPVEDNEKVRALRARLAGATDDAEADVYGHLADFFGRYYREGDFMSLRRYSGGGGPTYLIPYDGEEVKLHWANADQYYIKTAENYASYAFTCGGDARRVRFEIAAADNERDNVKEAADARRRFVPAKGGAAVALDGGDLLVRFEHRPLTDAEKKRWPGNGARQQDRIDADSAARILEAAERLGPDWRASLAAPAPTGADPERTLLARHVARYTAKNSFDYFIHKDLGGFLRRELDLYLKTEVLNVDDLAADDAGQLRRALARMRAVRHVGGKIVDFLAQLEDFQKRLWLKKKFVLETQWCVTLDRAPEALRPEIAANEAQRREWADLFAIDGIADGGGGEARGGASFGEAPALWAGETGDGEPLGAAFLEANPRLVLDTRHFDADFRDRLLAALSDAGPLDERTDGLLVHGENFQALNLLQARYAGQVQCVYIDPPYNTGDSEILYKNGYLRSSWLSLMANHFGCLQSILSHDSVLYIAIDDFEMANLSKLVDTQCPWVRREMIVVNHHPQGGKAKTLASTHEYMLVCIPITSDKTLAGRLKNGDVELRPFKRSGTAESNFRYARPNSFYAILVEPDSQKVVGLEPPPPGGYPTSRSKDGYIRVYPVGAQGDERVWRRSHESCRELVESGKLVCSNRGTIYQKIEAGERRAALFSNWIGPRYNAGTFGANLLSDIIGKPNPFPYPKSIHTVGDAVFAADLDNGAPVMDYFAGSGTTGHAVVNLNREDGGGRKYILVEMGDHFDTVMLPRLKKVVYAPDWKEGRPAARDKGVSQVMKYVRLESYEDTLDGLVLTPPEGGLLAANDPALVEDYRLRYALDAETASSPCLAGPRAFADPFAYTLSVVRDGARRAAPVDLPETFNLLLGLDVESRRRLGAVLAIAGRDARGRRCLVLWRNLEATDNAALNRWFAGHRACFPDPLDLVYVNGDHTLNAIRRKGETWTAETIEPLFRELMFEEGGR